MPRTATKEVRIGNGNQKVGPLATFSLPSETTCPGASEWCSQNCYALRMEKRWFNMPHDVIGDNSPTIG